MSECKDCRFWKTDSPGDKVGRCSLISELGRMGEARRAMSTSAVLTRQDFGCNDFQEHGLQETVPE